MRELLVPANFALTYTLPLKNDTFLAKIPSSRNLKVAIYKVSQFEGGKNRLKTGVAMLIFRKLKCV